MNCNGKQLVPAGFRCVECGRLDPESNQPCSEHADIEEVYRLVDEPTTECEPDAEWSTKCTTCGRTRHFILRDNGENDAHLHQREFPGHDVRLISIAQD